MTAIRIQLGAMDQLLTQIIDAALVGQSDFVVSRAANDPAGKPVAVGEDCDVLLVCPKPDRDPGVALASLTEGAPRSIVALLPHGEQATILNFTRETWPIIESADLCAAPRRAAGRSRAVAG